MPDPSQREIRFGRCAGCRPHRLETQTRKPDAADLSRARTGPCTQSDATGPSIPAETSTSELDRMVTPREDLRARPETTRFKPPPDTAVSMPGGAGGSSSATSRSTRSIKARYRRRQVQGHTQPMKLEQERRRGDNCLQKHVSTRRGKPSPRTHTFVFLEKTAGYRTCSVFSRRKRPVTVHVLCFLL